MLQDGRISRGETPKGDGRDSRSSPPDPYDVLIIGGGPAGLNAALVLGRCQRRVLVVDSGRPRNAAAQAMHGYLSRDGISPRDLLRIGRDEISRYGVEFRHAEVVLARGLGPEEGPAPPASFEIRTNDGRVFCSRKLLLTTGVRDVLPAIDGAERFYGRGVHHCPYCDGWEHRDQSLVAYGAGRAAVGLALSLKTWSGRVTACTDGERVGPQDHARLARNGIALRTERIVRLDGSGDSLEEIVFDSGPPLICEGFFFNTDQVQHSQLPAMLGCVIEEGRHVRTVAKQKTCTPGLFLAGDADGDVQFVIVAAAEGARAAVAINRELQDEDRGEARMPSRPVQATGAHRR